MEKLDRIKGCMIGGAIGDAFGMHAGTDLLCTFPYQTAKNKYKNTM